MATVVDYSLRRGANVKKSVFAVFPGVLVVLLLMTSPASATATARPKIEFLTPSTVASGLLDPTSFGVDGTGNIYSRQAGSPERITRITPGGSVSDLIPADINSCPPPAYQRCDEISAVSVRGGTVYYSVNVPDRDYVQEGFVQTEIRTVTSSGTPQVLASISDFEYLNNPDGATTYGFVDLPEACAAQFEREEPATYTGPRESHPSASVADAHGLYVADRAANAIFHVGYDGTVSTVAVLPPIESTNEQGSHVGDAPPCADGYDYRSQPLPSDLAIGPGGQLYVTTVPRVQGLSGDLYRIDPSSGTLTWLAGGFHGATGIAVAPKSGVIFVAEQAGGPNSDGQVLALLPGATHPAASVAVTRPAAVELRGSALYISSITRSWIADSKIVRLSLLPTFAW